MPTNPVLKGRRWTSKTKSKIQGRWILVGWIDSPAEPGIAIVERAGGDPGYIRTDGSVMRLDSPGQIIDIGPGIKRDCPYSKSGGEWTVEE